MIERFHVKDKAEIKKENSKSHEVRLRNPKDEGNILFSVTKTQKMSLNFLKKGNQQK